MKLQFYLRFHTRFGQHLLITGNTDELGNNDPVKALPLDYLNDEFWSGSIEIKKKELQNNISYKYILKNEEGELISGQLWAELEITQQTGRRDPAPERFKTLFNEIDNWVKKTFRKSHPKGFWVGPKTAKAVRQTGLKLRENKYWGRVIEIQGV